MKSIGLIFLFCVLQTCVVGQQTSDILLRLISKDNVPISSAHLTLDGNRHMITDNKGEIRIQSSDRFLNLKLSHIRYTQLDTTINIEKNKIHEITLKQNTYSIDPITISDKQRLFEKNNWLINDFTYHEYGFLVSASEKSEKHIYLFDQNGIQIQKRLTNFKHQTIRRGLKSGHFHLIGELKGQEIFVSTDTIIFLSIEPIEVYEKTINHFIYTNNDYTIAKEWAAHNKNLTLSKIDNNTFTRTPFYLSFDEENFIRSQSVYREIIGLYYRDCHKANPLWKPGDITDNIIADGTWSGDLIDLIVSDTIQEVYNYYKSIYTDEISVSTQIKSSKLFVLDNYKMVLSIYELTSKSISVEPIEIIIPDQIKDGEFMNSSQDDELIIRSDNNYFLFDIHSLTFIKIQYQKQKYYYPKTIFMDKNTLYALAQKSKIKYKKSIFRYSKL